MLERFSCYFAIRSSSDGSICGSNGCSSSGGSRSLQENMTKAKKMITKRTRMHHVYVPLVIVESGGGCISNR